MSGDSPSSIPWWESSLAHVDAALRTYLRRKAPALARDHDDIVHDTLLGITQLVRADPSAFPPSWFESATPASAEDRDYLQRLAYTIASRRIADRFRTFARSWAIAPADDADLARAASPAPSAERQRLVHEMLRVCVGVLAELGDEDRALVATLVSGDGEPSTRSDRDRQRLRRIRIRLIEALREKFGATVDELLREQD